MNPHGDSNDEDDDGYALFIKNGTPARFYIHRSIKLGGQRTVLKSKIRRYGGVVVDEIEGVDTMLVKMDPQARSALELSYDVDKNPKLRQIFVEDITFIQCCIKNGEFAHKRPSRRPMGGRSGGVDDRRVEFTDEDRRNLAHFIAMRIPDPKAGGRTGNALYQELCTLGNTDRSETAWARRHPWSSWREHYKKNRVEFDPWIADIVTAEKPGPKQLHGSDRRLNRQYRNSRQESSEEGSADDTEEENAEGEWIRQKRLRSSGDDEYSLPASPAKRRRVEQSPLDRDGRSVGGSSQVFAQMQQNDPGPSGTQGSPSRSQNISRPPPSQVIPSSQMTLVEGQSNLPMVRTIPRMAARRPRPKVARDEPGIITDPSANQIRSKQLPTLQTDHGSTWVDVGDVDIDPPQPPTPQAFTLATDTNTTILQLHLKERPIDEVVSTEGTSTGIQKQVSQQLNTGSSDRVLPGLTHPAEVSLSVQQQAPVLRRARRTKTARLLVDLPEGSRSRSVESTAIPPPARHLSKQRRAQAVPLQPLTEADVEERSSENKPSPRPRSTSLPTIAFLNQEEDDKDDVGEISDSGLLAPPGETLAEEQDVEELLVTDDYTGLPHADIAELLAFSVRPAHSFVRGPIEMDDEQTADSFQQAHRSKPGSSRVFDTSATPAEGLGLSNLSLVSSKNAVRFKSDNPPASLFPLPPPSSRTPPTWPAPSTPQNTQLRRGSTSSSETFPLAGTQASAVRKRIKEEEKFTLYRPPRGTRAAEHLQSRS